MNKIEDLQEKLIDVDALRSKIYKDYDRCHTVSEFIACILLRIEAAPIIEAEPVRHGEWHESWYTDTVCASICTNCGKVTTQARTQDIMTNVNYPVCPYCSAKMDGGAEDDQARNR